MKGTGMFVDSFVSVNLGFWSHLACSTQSANIFTAKVSFRKKTAMLLWRSRPIKYGLF